MKQLRGRRSTRRFSERPLGARRLGAVLAAFATSEDGRRAYGSAGGTYPLEIFCLCNNVSGPAGGHVAYYNADNHSLTAVRPLPPWPEYEGAVNLDCGETVPQLVVVFALMAERVTEKYGERGGRFALIDVGQAAQTLALRLVDEGLVGCACGGLLDGEIKSLLGLDGTSAQIALGYACGHAPRILAMSTLSTILAAILGVVFVMVGIPKLMGEAKMAANFKRWGYADEVRIAVGAVEVLAGALLLVGIAVQALAVTGVLLVICVMVGALGTHQRAADPFGNWVPPAVLLGLAVVLGVSLLP